MNSQAAPPTTSFKTKLAREPEDKRREKSPFKPITQSPIERLSPTDRTPEGGARIMHLRGKEQAQNTRNDQDGAPGRPRSFSERRWAHFGSVRVAMNDWHDCL